MGIEKLFMAYFIKTGNLPNNHTLEDFVECIKTERTVLKGLEDGLMRMNGFQEICTIDTYKREIPTWNDIEYFTDVVKLTEKFIDDII